MRPDDILALNRRYLSALNKMRTRVTGAVMFVDLVGSTEFKNRNPSEEVWLPRLAYFLSKTTNLIQQEGRVVKYIGDEVMGFFEEDNAGLKAVHCAERIVNMCMQSKALALECKIALDFGEVSMLQFGQSGRAAPRASKGNDGDPNGTVVDRCARIASRGQANTVLGSTDFVSVSGDRKRWSAAGKFAARGFDRPIEVLQLRMDGSPKLRIRDEKLTLAECQKRLARVEGYLAATRALVRPLPRNARKHR